MLQSTGNSRADDILRGAIAVLEAVFPGRIRGYYLVGSYADGSYVATSDLDVVPIFKGRVGEDERARCLELVRALDLISPIHLGVGLRDEEQSFADGGVGIKIGSVLVYGEDVRDRIPLWSLDRYRDSCVQACLDIAAGLRGSPDRLIYPLDYPDPHSPFYGYVQEMQTQNGVEPGTAALFGNLMFAASTIVTLRTGRYNASKSWSWKLYQECIGDEWGGFLEELYGTCKVRWEYRIPAAPEEQRVLRHLCEQALGFENHFLLVARDYLLERASGESAAKGWAVEQLARVLFPDEQTVSE